MFRHAAAPKQYSKDDPMDVRELKEDEAAETADALGKSYAKGVGKGKCKDEADNSQRECNCCGEKGHYARECWNWSKPSTTVKGKSKGQVYEHKKGQAWQAKSKGKGKNKGKLGKGQ